MAECTTQHLLQDSIFRNEKCLSPSTYTSSIGEDSMDSNESSSEITDDASSSNLFDLSEIMEQLPIKRGLSKFYKGKSESFTSLSRVKSIEDLVKKASPYRRNVLKASNSCGHGLNSFRPRAVISKKSSLRGSSFSSFLGKIGHHP